MMMGYTLGYSFLNPSVIPMVQAENASIAPVEARRAMPQAQSISLPDDPEDPIPSKMNKKNKTKPSQSNIRYEQRLQSPTPSSVDSPLPNSLTHWLKKIPQLPPININDNDLSFDLAHFMEDTETDMLLLSQVTDTTLCEGETRTI